MKTKHQTVEKAPSREDAIGLLAEIRADRTGFFNWEVFTPRLAACLEHKLITIPDLESAHREANTEATKINPLYTGPVRYVHGVSPEQLTKLKGVSFTVASKLVPATFLSRNENRLNIHQPFYEVWTANPAITNVGASTGNYKDHTTLIFNGETQLGQATIQQVGLQYRKTGRSEEDYPGLEETMNLQLGDKNVETLPFSNGWVNLDIAEKYVSYGETRAFDTIPIDIVRPSVTDKLNYDVHQFYDRGGVLRSENEYTAPKAFWSRRLVSVLGGRSNNNSKAAEKAYFQGLDEAVIDELVAQRKEREKEDKRQIGAANHFWNRYDGEIYLTILGLGALLLIGGCVYGCGVGAKKVYNHLKQPTVEVNR